MILHTRVFRTVIAATAVLAIAAPAAQARPFAAATDAAATTTVRQPAVIVRTTTTTAFNWTDAGVGAVSGLAAGVIAAGGAMAVRGRRRVALSS